MAAGTLSRAKRASLHAAQSRAERAEAELDHQAARAAAAERARIARELHDVVAHHVSLMAVQAEAAASLLPAQPERARQSVDIIGAHRAPGADRAAPSARRPARARPSRRPRRPPHRWPTSVTCWPRCARPGLPVEYEVTGTPATLAPGIELTAFRIVQEALTNTLRHADAAQARVTVYLRAWLRDAVGSRLRSAADRAATARSGSGFGLAGIAERVASCGGSLTVGPSSAPASP